MQIFHITTEPVWRDAQVAGSYEQSTVSSTLAEVGYIHASTAEQVQRTASMFYRDVPDPLVVLVLDTDSVEQAGTEVKFEQASNGAFFPHIYGPIRPAWVTAARPAHFSAEGALIY